MDKVNPNNENETKSDIFPYFYSTLTSFSIGRKILKSFNDFYDWHLSTALQNSAQTSKIK